MEEYLLPLFIVEDGSSNPKEIRLVQREPNEEDKLVWSSEIVIRNKKCPDTFDLKEEASHLLDRDGKLDNQKLVDLVKACGGDTDYASFLAALSNLPRQRLRESRLQSEMAIQQLVYTPISGILYCFNPTHYVADSFASAGLFKYTDKDRNPCTFSNVKPDAAVTVTPRGLVVLAHMELKPINGSNAVVDDIRKCVMLTSLSAMGLLKLGADDKKITIPFILNMSEVETAAVYTTIAVKNQQGQMSVEISHLGDFNMADLKMRTECVALLAVLLSKLKNILSTAKGLRATGIIDSQVGGSSRKLNESTDISGPRVRQKTSTPTENQSNCDNNEAATAGGEIANLKAYNIQLNPHDESPFYFVGEIRESRVFVKIWREGDNRTNRQDIETEINLLKRARENGVPCPSVVDRLTALSHDFNQRRYHRMVMTLLPNDQVKPSDVCAFGISLLDAVLCLHNAGVLHCDIKPANVVWNTKTKVASLIDFGHAQLANGSTAYVGTEGYTAPEVCRMDAPHSHQSEAYSVGKTLLLICGDMASEQIRQVAGVAHKLSCDDPTNRITLQEARKELMEIVLCHDAVLSEMF
jgi:Protein kinase domain